MYLDLPGRVHNTKLATTKPLQPLFEALSNSFHAIEDAADGPSEIKVVVERDSSKPALYEDGHESSPVSAFTVIDTGIGFDSKNWKSFNTSDSTYKQARGGKGVGRFIWLKAFDTVEVTSSYPEDGTWKRRRFDFTLSADGVENDRMDDAPKTKRETRVKLIGLKEEYQKHCPKGVSIIGERIVEHFLSYFFFDQCPHLTLVDGDESLDLNEVFREIFGSATETKPFTVKKRKFELRHLRIYSSRERRDHRIHLCAYGREVDSERITKLIREVPTARLQDEQDKEFVYLGYVSGGYLDEHVNSERTGFLFPERDTDLEFPDVISKESLLGATTGELELYLKPYLEPLREEKMERIEDFVHTKAPQYRPILKHKPEALADISPEIRAEADLDRELRRIQFVIEEELRETQDKLLTADLEKMEDFEEYFRQYIEFLEKENDVGKSNLAQYIAHRKAVINALEKFLGFTDSGKYYREEVIHRFICPLRTTSDDLGFEEHNLWLIDDRLAFHEYLASDLPLKKMDILETDDRDRPDLVVFNRSHAFAPDDRRPFSSVVLIEFKRPERTDYTSDENPIQQVYGYISKIRDAKAKDRQGQTIRVQEKTPFYVYVACTLTPSIERYAKDFGLTITPDGQGYFGFNANHQAYVEIIDYRKLVEDAKSRNRALFEKLNLR
ncbi:MAG: ATP-binding protein [Acidobacteriota bacterium]|nr:ATP-binding protein [Acidobacteriota bacterium]